MVATPNDEMKTALLLLFFIPLPVWAAPVAWQERPAASHIGFTAYWQGQAVKGEFPHFDVKAKLDPDHPGGGKISLRISMGELTTQTADITRAIRGQAWFDVKDHPEASFTSESITKQADGTFQLSGKLAIKGHAKILAFPLKITRQGQKLELAGNLQLDRSDFAIGAGRWTSGKIIAHKVDVVFSIVLVRKH